MAQDVTLTSADGFRLGAARADPEGEVRGGVVVIQEIFGVNQHIRSICDRLAAQGYCAIAPSIFDRMEPGFTSGYTAQDVAVARKFVAAPDWDAMLRDTEAAIDAARDSGAVGIIGFCLGGSIAFRAALKASSLKAAIGFYGSAIAGVADQKPQVPVQLHFGEEDGAIPLSDVETIRAKRPEVEVFTYPGAGHGFHCDARASYHQASAEIAWQRSMAFLARHLTT